MSVLFQRPDLIHVMATRNFWFNIVEFPRFQYESPQVDAGWWGLPACRRAFPDVEPVVMAY